eukprot:15450338-Alexandrium_andersonii.AAC.1
MRCNCFKRSNLELHSQERPQHRSPTSWRGGVCAVVRADGESADEAGWRERRRRFSGVSGGERVPPGGALCYAT